MLDQISRFSDGDYEQSLMVQLFFNCIDRAATPSTAFVWFRGQPMHVNDDQTLSLRVVDPFVDEGVWAIIDDGCYSCCHGEVWRQNAEAKMKVLRLRNIWVHRKSNYCQWCRNEHDKRKAEISHCHTTARIRHGDTRLRAFT